MATTFTWNCKTVDTYTTHTDSNDVTHSDVVFNVHYRLTGEEAVGENNYHSEMIGTVEIDVNDLSQFTEFESVTNEISTNWVKGVLGEDQVLAMKASIEANIAEQKTPTIVTKFIEN